MICIIKVLFNDKTKRTIDIKITAKVRRQTFPNLPCIIETYFFTYFFFKSIVMIKTIQQL